MYGIRQRNLFLRAYMELDGSPLWREFDQCRGNIYIKETLELLMPRFTKLEKIYKHIHTEVYKFSERELVEIVIMKLKG